MDTWYTILINHKTAKKIQRVGMEMWNEFRIDAGTRGTYYFIGTIK